MLNTLSFHYFNSLSPCPSSSLPSSLGTLDCVFCADLALKKVRKYVHEMDRVLKDGGTWIIFSNGLPEDRLPHFENDDQTSIEFLSFDCTVYAVAKPNVDAHKVTDLKNLDELYFVYVLTKDPDKAKVKIYRKNKLFLQKEGRKAMTKKNKEKRDKDNIEGHLALTPYRDQFGNPREAPPGKEEEEAAAREEADMMLNSNW
jgi:hypothetical protein